MAEHPQGLRRSEKVRGKDIAGKIRALDTTYSQQLTLFQTFFLEDASDDKYSNTIELYDAVPRYVTNPKLVNAMRKGGKYLPLMQRQFYHRWAVYQVTIRPARLVDRQGVEKEYYPGIREELLEDALRKLALEQLNAWCEILSDYQCTKSAKASRGRPSCSFNQIQKLCKAIFAAKRA